MPEVVDVLPEPSTADECEYGCICLPIAELRCITAE